MESYETKVSSISKIMEEAYRKQREYCLCVEVKPTEEEEEVISPQITLKNFYLSKYENNFTKMDKRNNSVYTYICF